MLMNMRVNDIKKVKPAKDNIIVKNIELDKDNELFFAKSDAKDLKNAPLSIGEVVAIGPTATNLEHCPDLSAGDNVIYNTFAGSHIATNELSELYKIMGGYSVMAKLDDINKLDENTVHPTSNRVLLAVKFTDQTEDGLFLPANESKDPRLEDLDYGTILKTGPACKLGYKVGDIVAYQPYAGENVRTHPCTVETPMLRVLIEEDILLTI